MKLLGAFALSVALLTPVCVNAAQHPDAHEHVWNDGENTYWHQYLREHHRKDRDWAKASKRDRDEYWKWRDQHRDHDHH